MRAHFAILLAVASIPGVATAQPAPVTITLDTAVTGPVISRNLFGQFAEQLGEGIYGGVWVGRNSPIPNVRGIRSDVVAALRDLKVPDVRWPGGCFADSYHWRDGVGPAAKRPVTYNANWGQPIESNRFGTDEFMDFIDQIGSRAYISVNVGSGTPREASEWLEYMTSAQPTALTAERASNGHPAPYKVAFLGLGNEVWACGGQLSAQSYLQSLKTFAYYARNLNPEQSGPMRFIPGPNPMQRIAVGPGDDNPEFTEVIMHAWASDPEVARSIEGLSLHHYTMGAKGMMRDSATEFGPAEYAAFVQNAYAIDKLVADNAAIMDKYDPKKKVGLVVDEWGTWLQPMPGTPPLNLKQQNSLRDAIVAAIHLNIFARHADRVRMANIAQMVNVLQSMVITDGAKMVVTPTYQVFRMYVPFQDAALIPIAFDKATIKVGGVDLPRLDGIAARSKDGSIWLAVTNIDPDHPVTIRLPGIKGSATGKTLTATQINAVNTFDKPFEVMPRPLEGRAGANGIAIDLPAKSVSVLQIR
jgi:alpha-N-arabinofuranosidase